MLDGRENENQRPQTCNKGESDNQASTSSVLPDTDSSNRSSSLSSEHISASLNPRITFQRALSSLYSRWVKVSFNICNFIPSAIWFKIYISHYIIDYVTLSLQIMTEEDPRFGSCNEFTIGMSRSPRHSRDTLSNHATYFENNEKEAHTQDGNQHCGNHRRKNSCD